MPGTDGVCVCVDVRVEVPDLRAITLELLTQIPRGRVTTYRALARALGDPIASRAVGEIMADNDWPERYPCYKVVHSDGRVGRYSGPGGTEAKIAKLVNEGIPVADGRVVNLERQVFHRFETDRPLARLRGVQEELVRHVVQEPLTRELETVGGVDLSYKGRWLGVGAYVLVDAKGGGVRATESVEHPTPFPYIPTYLAFRELPVLMALLERVRAAGKLADLVMVDGSGVLHHRHVGIASHLGVLLGIPTVGVIKTLLYGNVDREGMAAGEVRPVIDPESGVRIGAAVKTSGRADPIYVSVGHGVDLDTAVALALELSSGKLPEPIREAHRLSRRVAQGPSGSRGQQALDL